MSDRDPMMQFTLSDLIRPNEAVEFLRDDWGRRTRHYPRSLAGVADSIMTLASFELVLATLNRAHEGWLHVARGAPGRVPPEMIDGHGLIDLRKLRAAFAAGDTLYLTKAERLAEPLMHLSRAVEVALSGAGVGLREAVSAHVFLTPPRSQGFAVHRDAHASFVLQLDGAKEWSVYTPVDESAGRLLEPGPVDVAELARCEKQTFRLETGDVLYMPEWWPHEARASESHSLHVTLRMFPLRWADVLSALTMEHPALAATVTRGVPLHDGLMTLLESGAFKTPLPRLLDEFEWRNAVPKTELPADGFRQVLNLDGIGAGTRLVRSASSPCRVMANGAEASIRFPGGAIRGPAVIRRVFEYVAGVHELRPMDLPELDGEEYDRVAVARTMVRDGLLQIKRGQG